MSTLSERLWRGYVMYSELADEQMEHARRSRIFADIQFRRYNEAVLREGEDRAVANEWSAA